MTTTTQKYARTKITGTELELDGSRFIFTFKPDGIHIREKYKHGGDRIIRYAALLSLPAITQYPPGSPPEHLAVAAEDLKRLAFTLDQLNQGPVTRADLDACGQTLAEAKKSALNALRIIRSLELTGPKT